MKHNTFCSNHLRARLGLPVGFSVGAREGFPVGFSVGLLVGLYVGLFCVRDITNIENNRKSISQRLKRAEHII